MLGAGTAAPQSRKIRSFHDLDIGAPGRQFRGVSDADLVGKLKRDVRQVERAPGPGARPVAAALPVCPADIRVQITQHRIDAEGHPVLQPVRPRTVADHYVGRRFAFFDAHPFGGQRPIGLQRHIEIAECGLDIVPVQHLRAPEKLVGAVLDEDRLLSAGAASGRNRHNGGKHPFLQLAEPSHVRPSDPKPISCALSPHHPYGGRSGR